MSDLSRPSASERGNTDLAALAAEFFTFVLAVQSEGEPQPGELRRRATEALRTFADRARAAGQPHDTSEHCRFVMTALLDEVVMTSRWAVREQWAQRPLAYELFDDLNAGETVYERLEKVRRQSRGDGAAVDALEVFATALCLGFKGCKVDPGDEERLRDLVGQLNDQVREARGQGNQLSPHWQPDQRAAVQVRRLPRWWLAAGALTLVALLVLVLELIQAGDWRRALDVLEGRN